MIAYIEGKLAQLEPNFAVIDTGGVAYLIRISLQTYSQIKQMQSSCKLYTHLVVKEDAHTLYGFYEQVERKVFQELISVSGIGPGTAMLMLSSMDAMGVQNAIAQEDVKTIQSVKGIGGKTAQRLILELKDKMKKENLQAGIDTQVVIGSDNNKRSEALMALVTLGIPKNVAEKNIDAILKKEPGLMLEQIIKQALRMA